MGWPEKIKEVRARASDRVADHGTTVFSQIAWALGQFVWTAMREATAIYFLVAVQLFLWSLFPLMVLFGLFFWASGFGPWAMGFSLFVTAVVVYVVGTFIFSLIPDERENPDPRRDAGASTNIDTSAKDVDNPEVVSDYYAPRPSERRPVLEVFRHLGQSLARVASLFGKLLKGEFGKNETLGFLIRLLLLVIGVVYATPHLTGYDLSTLNNPLMEFARASFFVTIERPISIAIEVAAQLLVLFLEFISGSA